MATHDRTTTVQIRIPDDLDFASLGLSRDPVTHDIEFDWAPIERICAENGLDVGLFRDQHEDNVSGLIATWYMEHRARGGAPDQVQEQIIAEVHAEDALGTVNVQAAPGSKQ